jgi:hypothetical protein
MYCAFLSFVSSNSILDWLLNLESLKRTAILQLLLNTEYRIQAENKLQLAVTVKLSCKISRVKNKVISKEPKIKVAQNLVLVHRKVPLLFPWLKF